MAARSVDLQLATYDGSACGTYSDNLTASIDVSVGLPAVGSSERPGNTRLGRFCLRNVGNVAAAVTISSLVDSSTEIDCTGDEATDDTTCAAGLEGELHTRTQWLGYSVPMGTPWGGGSWGGSRSFGTLTPGAEAIFGLDLAWPSESNHIGAQSDQLLTHFVFDGAVA